MILLLDATAEVRVSMLPDSVPDAGEEKASLLLCANYTFRNREVLPLLAASLVNLLVEIGVDSLGYLDCRSLILINLSMQTSPS